MKNWGLTFFIFCFSTLCFSGEGDESLSAFNISDLPVQVRAKIGEEFKSPEDRWWVRDITSGYPWLVNARILWLLDSGSNNSVVIYLGQSGKAVILNQENGFDKIYSLLETHFSDILHDDVKRIAMLNVVKDWVIEPRGHIGSTEFWMKEKPVLDSWLLGDNKESAVFKKYCADPNFFFDQMNDSWTISYFVFNPEGGVNLVKVFGTDKPFRINKISVEIVKEAGSFYFPDEL